MVAAVRPLDIDATAAAIRNADVAERRTLFLLGVPALAIMAALLLAPLAWLTSLSLVEEGSFSLGHYGRILSDPFYVNSFWLTIRVAAIVTVASALGGYVLAYAMTLMPPWLRGVSLALVALPFWTSVLVRTYAWLVLLQNRGLINNALIKSGLIETPLHLAHNVTGTVIGMIHVMLPFIVFPLYAAMQRVDPDYVRAAFGLGASPSYAFWRVYFPLTVPALTAGSVLVFVLSLGFFITPALLGGGRTMMMALVIERDVHLHLNWGPASAVAVLFVLAVLAIFALLSRYMSLDRVFQR